MKIFAIIDNNSTTPQYRLLHWRFANQPIVSSTDPTPKRRKGFWYTSSAFWGAQNTECHVIIMTTHQRLSRAAIANIGSYSALSHDNNLQDTWRKSDWCKKLQKCHVSKPQKALNVYQTLSSWWGLGTRLISPLRMFLSLLLCGHIVLDYGR